MSFDEDTLRRAMRAVYELEPIIKHKRALSWDEAVGMNIDLSIYKLRAEAILSSSYAVLVAKGLSESIFNEAKEMLDRHWAQFYGSWEERVDHTILSCVYSAALMDLAARIAAHVEMSSVKFKLIAEESIERAMASLPRFG